MGLPVRPYTGRASRVVQSSSMVVMYFQSGTSRVPLSHMAIMWV